MQPTTPRAETWALLNHSHPFYLYCCLYSLRRGTLQLFFSPTVMSWPLKESSSFSWLWRGRNGSSTPCAISTTRSPSPRLSSSVTPRERYGGHQMGMFYMVFLSQRGSSLREWRGQTQLKGLVVSPVGNCSVRRELKRVFRMCLT